MHAMKKSYWITLFAMAVIAAAITLLPTIGDLDKNAQSHFCVHDSDGNERRADCDIDLWRLFERFFFYYSVIGGALVGPFVIYLLLSSLKYGAKAVYSILRRR
jgi:hypothetical protein